MYLAKYLLSIEEFMDLENGEALMERAFLCVDGERREKAAGMRDGRARAASLGAGLLLQLAVREALSAAGGKLTGDVCDVLPGIGGKLAGYVQDVLPECGEEALVHEPESRETDASKCEGESGETAEVTLAVGEEAGPDSVTTCATDRNFQMRRYTVSRLLEILQYKPPLEIAYRYGKNGKPYFQDLPFYFNLSHSGEYVLCVIATEEIGADIQQHRLGKKGNPSADRDRDFYGKKDSGGKKDLHGQAASCRKRDYPGRLAARFFSDRERAVLEQAGGEQEKERLFFRLWARKEAYGKLTGEGVAGVLDMDMLQGAEETGAWGEAKEHFERRESGEDGHPKNQSLCWEEYGGAEGYSIAICRHNRTASNG